MSESQRIDELRREVDDLDRSIQLAYAVNEPKELEKRRRELQYKLRVDPRTPEPTWTKEEMDAAAQRLVDKFANSDAPWINP